MFKYICIFAMIYALFSPFPFCFMSDQEKQGRVQEAQHNDIPHSELKREGFF